MRDSGVDHLQEFILTSRVLVHDVFGLVNHLYQAVLFTHHLISLALDLEVTVWLWILLLNFIKIILLLIISITLADHNLLENDVV